MSPWPSVAFGDVVSTVTPSRKVKRSAFLDSGAFPIISQEADPINGWWNEASDLIEAPGPVIIFGDHTRVVKYVDEPFVVGADGVKILVPGKALLPRFLFYWLSGNKPKSLGYARHFRLLADKRISLPPLDEQERIIAKLDEISVLTSQLNVNVSSQIAAASLLRMKMLEEVFAESAPLMPLGDLVTILDSNRVPITKKDRTPGSVPYYGATGIQDYVADFIFDEPLVLLGEDGAKWAAGDRSAFLISGKTWVNNHAHVLRPDRSKVLDEWLAEWLCVSDLTPFVSGATVPKLNQARMREIAVPVPPIEKQREAVKRIQRIQEDTQLLEANMRAMVAELEVFKREATSMLLASAS